MFYLILKFEIRASFKLLNSRQNTRFLCFFQCSDYFCKYVFFSVDCFLDLMCLNETECFSWNRFILKFSIRWKILKSNHPPLISRQGFNDELHWLCNEFFKIFVIMVAWRLARSWLVLKRYILRRLKRDQWLEKKKRKTCFTYTFP